MRICLYRILFFVAVSCFLAGAPVVAAPKPAVDKPDKDGLYNVSLVQLGATAKGSGSAFNKDWPPNNTLQPGLGGGGTLVSPLTKARVDIKLIVPVEIRAIEVVGLDYGGTLQPKAIDIFVDGKMLKHADLEEKPGQPILIPLLAQGQSIGILITDEYPVRDLGNGKKGPKYGGWSRLRVLSPQNVSELLKPVDSYRAVALTANITPTIGAAAQGKIEVVGEPRMTVGHPNTLWDKEDIAHYKDMLNTSKALQTQFAGLKKAMDVRLTQPAGIPEPQKGTDGKWRHISDLEVLDGKTYGAVHNQLSLDIANLGTVYVLTGDEKYADFCKKLLLAYADAYANYAVGARPGFNHAPSKAFDQVLGDATWLPQLARGYDLIYNLPSIKPEEREHIEDDLLKAVAKLVVSNHSMLEAPTNWSAIGTASVLAVGYATDDQELINTALYGIKGTKEKPTGGLFLKHFGSESIDADGMWAEGAMGYQFMALEALVLDAEILWHHGTDMYRYRDCALKNLFDSPLRYSYPDLMTPAIHDSGHGSIVGTEAFLYEYAYRRYRDPSYLSILNQAGMQLAALFQQFPVSVLFDRELKEKTAPVELKSVNFFGVGYGMLRTTTEAGTNSLMLDFGPNRSHGHPDKLNIDLYAFNAQLIPDPGSVWYEQPLYRDWYHSTLAHNTLVVDELDQVMSDARQLVYGTAESMGIQRAWTDKAYAGITMDRSIFLTANYMADIFGAFTRLPRKFDLAWHILGQFSSGLKFEPMAFPEPKESGYKVLENVRHATVGGGWKAAVTQDGRTARLIAADGGGETEVILGDGYYKLMRPPAVLERRVKGSTVYGNVIDISGVKDGYVKNVVQEGSLDAGFGLLKVETVSGTDLCFAAFRPGVYRQGELESDAQQAFVLMDGRNVRAMYLGGGKILKLGEVSITRSEPGLAYFEKTETGAYLVGNPSPVEGTVTVVLPAIGNMEAFRLDAEGKRIGAADLGKVSGKDSVLLALKPVSRVELAVKGSRSVFESRQEMLQKRQAAQEAALNKAKEECTARTKVREAEARMNPVPANTLVAVQAEAFSGQGGGGVAITDKKRGALGTAFSSWDALGHWLEWTFEVPAEGYYNLSICYCSQLANIEREIKINGEVQEPFAPMNLPTTGGWANGSDDWQLFTAGNPVTEQPLLLKFKKGKNVVRLTNMNGRGANMDYLVVTSPDLKATREAAAAKLNK